MSYLLDTNVCIELLNGRNFLVRQRLEETNPTSVFLCTIVKAELYYGAYRGNRTEANLALLNEFFSQFRCIPFEIKAAEIFGQIRATLNVQGLPIGPYDLLIASIALAHNLTLITHNTREFGRIPSLRCEDWETM